MAKLAPTPYGIIALELNAQSDKPFMLTIEIDPKLWKIYGKQAKMWYNQLSSVEKIHKAMLMVAHS